MMLVLKREPFAGESELPSALDEVGALTFIGGEFCSNGLGG